ncbi:hypothetical protein ADK76_18505 [Streptomyces griseoflavus]|uniref:hypothetical protein n=1 Tax=Streptomyces rimosus TaxID=1927 RepID=UPI0004C72DDB|nr:hypothetical protein [Streptomyces rimosus]KOG57062.1 hypothetical protein ADK76_18505 [Streptomyces griseoflavus]
MSAHTGTADAALAAAGWPPTRRPVRVAPAQVRTLDPPTRHRKRARTRPQATAEGPARTRQVPGSDSLLSRFRAAVRHRWHEAQRAAASQIPAGTVKRGRA